jgi:DNA-binding winged helix-turn-helix (wHTH) protein/tetratricopeptide (TPR) repeat protein
MTAEVKPIYRFADFTLDANERRLLQGEHEAYLPPKTFEMLLYLVEHHGHLIKKNELLDALWADTFVTEAALTQRIREVRETLGDDAHEPHYIKTIPRVGYKFIAEVEAITESVCAEESEEEFTAIRVVETQQGEETEPGGKVSEAQRRPASAVEQVPARLSARTTSRRSTRMLLVALAAGVLLAGLILFAYTLWPKPPQPARPIKSLAVLPFKPLVTDSRDESFELGMADTLITRLGSLREISVRPLSAVRQYTDLEQDAVAAGREQRVDAVLDASFQRSGETIRVTVRLLNVKDGTALWTYKYDEQFTDFFAVQDAISEQLAGVLAVKLTGDDRQLLAKRYTDNPQAYQAYLKGRFFWQKRTGGEAKKAVAYFEQAIRLDPNYALAYAGLSDTTAILGDSGFIPIVESRQKALASATKALELDDTLAEAHATLALAIVDYHRDWPAGERHFRRAIALNPSYAEAHEWYASHLSCLGRHEEAIVEAQRAQELDPLSLNATRKLGFIFFNARRYDRAIEQLQTVLDLDPDNGLSHFFLGLVYVHTGRHEEAISEFQKVNTLSGGRAVEAVTFLGYTYAITGQRDKAEASLGELDELATRRYVAAFPRAVIYTGLGAKERTFEWLEKAYAGRDWQLRFLKVIPIFDPLRSDPRFTDLLKRVGLGE